MACIGEENWVSFCRMSLDRGRVHNPETDSFDAHANGDDGRLIGPYKKDSSNGFVCKFERVFPVYARGSSRPDPPSVRCSVPGSGDSIWDSIREEAKSEVPPLLH